MKTIFCGPGNKTRLSKKILKLLPPDYEKMKYVEPFFGSGAIYFQKNPSLKEVINDIDKELMAHYKLIKISNTNDIEKINNLKTLEQLNNFVNIKGGSNTDKLAKFILKSCNTFTGRMDRKKLYTLTNPFNKLKNLNQYKERLKNTTILNTDYKNIIKKYDSTNTIFYLDPPYENSSKQNVYKNSDLNYNELSDILKNIKGKFILSLNDSINIRNLFNGFKIIGFVIKARNINNTIGSKARKEVFILNF